jgi:4-amino-4-deoxy-L-arabinose transferase-like glycosyltransferase
MSRYTLIGLILLAFGLRLYDLGGSSLWYDELLELDIAQGPFNQIWPQLEWHAAMPLDYYLLHSWIRGGRQEAWVRFPALVAGTLAVPVIYTLARRLFNRRTAYLAALLLACASFAVRYSQEARPYTWLLLWVPLGYLGVWQAYRTRRRRYWGLALLGLVGAVLTHYFSLFVLLPLGLFMASQQTTPHLRPKQYWQHLACFGLTVTLILVVFVLAGRFWRLYSVGLGFARAAAQPAALILPAAEKPNRGSGPPLELTFWLEEVLYPLATPERPGLLLYAVFSLLGLLSLFRSERASPQARPRPAVFLLATWLVLPPLLIYLFLLQRGTFFAARYILYTLPAFLLLVAHGLDRLADFGRTAAGLLLFLALVPLTLAEATELHIYYTADSREDWRAVGQLLRQNAGPDDAVIALRAEPALNWYYPPAVAAPGTYRQDEVVAAAIREHPRRWFILSSYSQRYDKSWRNWLHQNQAVRIPIDRRVVVFIQQDGQPASALLDEVRTFSLPPKAATYIGLADQLRQQGNIEASQALEQKATELAAR